MDQLLTKIIAGDLDAASLLLLFIVGILTKRFVPLWIHEEALEKLEQYESTAPALLDEIGDLIELMQTQTGSNSLTSDKERELVDSLGPKIKIERQRTRRRVTQRRKKEALDDST